MIVSRIKAMRLTLNFQFIFYRRNTMNFTAAEKRAIIRTKVTGGSSNDVLFALYEVSGRKGNAYTIGKSIKENASITEAIQAVSDYIDTNIDSIVTLEDDVEVE